MPLSWRHLASFAGLFLSGAHSHAVFVAASGQCLLDPFRDLRSTELGVCPLSVAHELDDSSREDTDPVAKWEDSPFCARDESRIVKYCVYTSADFNSNTGVSFIIRPETLPEATSLVQNVDESERSRKHLSNRIQSDGIDIAYEVVDLPGKGQGVVARRAIHRGETFIVGLPAIVIDQELEDGPDPAISEEDRLELHKVAFELL